VIWGALLLIALALWLFIPSIPTTALLIAIGVTGGSMLHILGDLMTTAPVRGALYPVSEKLFWILPRFMRFNVGSGLEQVYFLLFALLLGAFGVLALGDAIKAFDLSFGR
jgi:membrane-bound metal-dependent hydrolase YbcI (DUF457 family)